jgi:para-nitrobenzyl esterase
VTVAHGHDPARAETRAGTVQGIVEDGVVSFKGIPFAAPPTGELRWGPPQPEAPWSGLRKAASFVHDCMQQVTQAEVLTVPPSEDCLYLNVWRPEWADEGDRLPVMVWIHGGGFVGGGTSSPTYDGSAFARQGIIVVSSNYRLGRLGFFAHPAVLVESGTGNFGTLDQVAALRWVQEGAAAFGGDPERVTIVGESAGGASVLNLLTSAEADGLFHQAMVMSGGGRQPLVTRQMTGGTAIAPSADQVDLAFAESLGIAGDGADALEALRALDEATLNAGLDLEAVFTMAFGCVIAELRDPATYDPACRPSLAGTPMIDGWLVTGAPQDAFLAGANHPVPIVIGTTAADLPEFFPPRVTDPYPYFGGDARAARRHYALPFLAQAALLLKGQSGLRQLLPVAAIGADMTMHEPARFIARETTLQGAPAWLYRFTYTAESTRPGSKKQVHAGELPFLFDTLESRYGDAVTDADRRTAAAFNTYVGNFVRTGDPNGSGLPTWPAFDPAAVDLLDFSLEDGPVFRRDDRAAGIEIVERALDRMARSVG